ncbi:MULTISPECIES: hypothetical protein [unclassified Nocardioides]|uniref:hypothetical protein n=1 Tax=unclassified Nocardioides TaxID=2615069 RepID=UPI0009F10A0A|nr:MULTISPECIES: hypothetical protein [unclassified Nocardioides]GAW50874.1 hypothetical protein PD653B2_3210 [Nocardioides sp. PD653-B2]GAW54032.1 hypothetical protein PD653_1439 [Nocardioides sp. PD653]
MTPWFDHCRRAVSVLLVVLSLLAIPAVADAKFTSSQPSTLSVGADKMEMPTAVRGSYSCTKWGNTEYISVTITGFTDSGPTDATYGFSLALGNNVVDTVSSPVKRQTLTGSRSSDFRATTWIVGVHSSLGNWTGAAWTKDLVCNSNGTGSGSW